MDIYRKTLGPSSKSKKPIPQSEPLNARQSRNHAGGYGYTVSDLQQLTRFLILGSQGGTYYVGTHTLTKENLLTVERMLDAGYGKIVIETIVQISEAGRAVSNDPALFALA